MSQLKLTIVGDPTPLRNATRQAERSLRNMQATAQKASAGINKAFGAVGLGLGFAALTNGLKQATKAASDDRKAQGLLAGALQKTVGANAEAIAGAEQYIAKTQLQTAVLDDALRPALAQAVRATGSLTAGQRVLDIALDVSAETGKDLGSVTKALSLAFNGNANQLRRLIPGLDTTGDVIGRVEKGFQGAAEKAANLDPYKRLELIFAEIQETIGAALLPALEEFAAYITSPDGQKNLEQIVDLFVAMGKAITNVSRYLIENIDWIKAIVAALITAKISWTVLSGAVKIYTVLTRNAVTATKLLRTALITTGIGALVVGVGFLADAWMSADEEKDEYFDDPNLQPQIPQPITTDDPNDPREIAQQKNIDNFKQAATKLKNAIKDKTKDLQRTAESFRDAVGLAFGTFGKDENSVFNVDVVISKLKRVVEAAKGFAGNLQKLRKAGATEDVISEIVGMGPAQGNIVAKGLLGSGKLQQYLSLRGSLYNTGAQAGAQQAISGNASYTINLDGANVKATDIIKAIRAYEKQQGRKYLVGP